MGTLLSLHALQDGRGDRVTRWWRAQFTADNAVRGLFPLAPPVGYSPDFLTPPEGANSLEAAVDAIVRTPQDRIRRKLDRVDEGPHPARGRARVHHDGTWCAGGHFAGLGELPRVDPARLRSCPHATQRERGLHTLTPLGRDLLSGAGV
jgi:hypothetical protein